MAIPMSNWKKKKIDAIRERNRLTAKGGYAKSKIYIKSAIFKYGSIKNPHKIKEYRVMKRK